MDEQTRLSGLGTTDFFAESLLHESIRESGNPYRFTANGSGINRLQSSEQSSPSGTKGQEINEAKSDILSVYNSM